MCLCRDIRSYLHAVLSGKLPVNHDIMAGLQDVCNLLPNTDVGELTRAFSVKSNDMMLAIYVASLVRSVLALHNLLNNKVRPCSCPQLQVSGSWGSGSAPAAVFASASCQRQLSHWRHRH